MQEPSSISAFEAMCRILACDPALRRDYVQREIVAELFELDRKGNYWLRDVGEKRTDTHA